MDYRFCCYGTYCQSNFKCLIKCPDKEECEEETKIRKFFKYEMPKEENKNEQTVEG